LPTRRSSDLVQEEPFLTAHVDLQHDDSPDANNKEVKALVQSLKDAAFKILKLNPEIPQEAHVAMDNIHSTAFLIHFLSSNLNVGVGEKKRILETQNIIDWGTVLLQFMLRKSQM